MNAHRRRRHYSYAMNMPRRRHRGAGLGGGTGILSVVKHPVSYLMNGTFGVLGAWFAITLPNQFLPFPGTDMMSRLLRTLTRIGAGSLVYWVARRFLPRSAPAIAVGSAIGVAGSFVFDLLGTQFVIGAGDTTQVPLALLATATRGTSFGQYLGTGLASYSVPMLPSAGGMSAYSRGVLPAARGMSGMYSSMGPGLTKHGLYE